MSDAPPRLELLHFARRVVQQATASLAELDGWIADAERRGGRAPAGQGDQALAA
ncbi:hypothetical protein OG613_44770 (plasmid) [Streptomyces sp. NBC_00015]|uniref:hypothetical protein n=1 Tax=Streptomyces sp. NBC_00015 TaxID=2903611 RepID=UPI002F90EDA0